MDRLPPELIQLVFSRVDVVSLAKCSAVNREWRRISEAPELWKKHCSERWKKWGDWGNLDGVRCDGTMLLQNVDWRRVWLERITLDCQVPVYLKKTGNSREARKEALAWFRIHRANVIDALKRELDVYEKDPFDHLTLKHYGKLIACRIRDEEAASRWEKYKESDCSVYEDAAIILCQWKEERDGVAVEVKDSLDEIAREFEVLHGTLFKSPLDKLKSLHAHLFGPEGHFRGNEPDYYDVENSYITTVLKTGLGIPITLCLLFCAVSRRLGVRVVMLNTPGHVICRYGEKEDAVFINCFVNNRIVDDFFGADGYRSLFGSSHDSPFNEGEGMSASELGLRLIENLIPIYRNNDILDMTIGLCTQGLALEQNSLRLSDRLLLHLILNFFEAASEDLEAADVYLKRTRRRGPVDPVILNRLEAVCDDVLSPWLNTKVHRRDADTKARFHVGMTFWHRQYAYRAVVTGWDNRCCASEQWMMQMRILSIPRGPDQPFYHSLVDGRDRPNQTTYVAENNLSQTGHEVGPIQHSSVGQHFNRYDAEANVYILNDEWRHFYPDDDPYATVDPPPH